MSAVILTLTVLNTSSNEQIDVKFDLGNVKYLQFTLGPNEMGTHDNVVVETNHEDFVASQRPSGFHTWYPLEGSAIVVQMIEKVNNRRIYLGSGHGSSVREALTKHVEDSGDIEYNEDYGDYDVTCTKCGMCFICANESVAQNTLFQHRRDEH